jgi:O-antigen/teichoic acid export membrane protein
MGLVAGGSLILVGPKLLELGFGTEFSRGYIALAILCVGQCLSAFMGASMIVLNMTRNERQVAHAFLLSMLANVLGNLLVTPKYGLVGAATSVAISVILLNGMLALQVRRHLRLNPFAVGGWPPVSGGEYVR